MSADPLAVALDLPLRAGDASFTFAAGAAAGVPRGTGVVVPFGARLLPGIVLGPGEPRPGLRPVLARVEPTPLVPAPVVDLAEWTAREYVSSTGEALAVAVPWDALWSGLRLWCRDPVADALSPPARAIAGRIAARPQPLSRAARLFVDAPEALAELAETGVLSAIVGAPSVWRAPTAAARVEAGDVAPGPGEEAVRAVVAEAMAADPHAVLVVGWPRTAAYLAAARAALASRWAVAALFPSVDAAEGFAAAAAAAGLPVHRLHAGLAPAARLAAWRGLAGMRGVVVVGTRAAVFAPAADPLLLIVDDEDASGHKEERAPRFLTAAVAAHRARDGALLVGATTPTVARFAETQTGACRLIALPTRRPRVGVIDLRRRPDPAEPISRAAREAVRRVARAGGRALVVADRKGYAAALHCAECGAVERCPSCGVAMVYDRASRRLSCRLCGRRLPAPDRCARCGGVRLRPLGAGTERLAAVLRRSAPRVMRFDADAVARGGDADAMLAPFRARGGALVATTYVLPYLPSLHLDLIVLTAADRWLHRPEYRAAERALALLRTLGITGGAQVLVETADPEHPVLRAVLAPGLRTFYDEELTLRRQLGFPPYRVLAAVTISGRSVASVDSVAAHLAAARAAGVEVLGPALLRARAGAREVGRALVVRAPDRTAVREVLWPVVTGAAVPPGVRVAVDVEPIEL